MKSNTQNTMDLGELHAALLVLMKKFHALCKKYDIQYSIGFGTMLGAIRHKGFIPWDDDVDIIITRKEYEKFLKIPASEFEPEVFFQTVKTEKGYPYNTARLRLNNSAMIYEKWLNAGFHQGVYIDIIVLDNIPDSPLKARIQRAKIIALSPFRFMMNKNVFFSSGKNIPMGLKRVAYALFGWLPFDKIYDLEVKVERKYEHQQCQKIGFLGEGNLFLKKWYPVNPLPAAAMQAFVELPFEDTVMMCSANYKELLEFWYGDYMKLPPKEKQVVYHNPLFFSGNVSYAEYLEKNA